MTSRGSFHSSRALTRHVSRGGPALALTVTVAAVLLGIYGCNTFDSPSRPVPSPAIPSLTAVVPTVPPPRACEPTLDADGDGVFVNATVQCPGTASLSESQTDCDDGDAEHQAWATFFVDQDGDGVGVSTGYVSGCAGKLLPGYVERIDFGSEDCDDADASVQFMGSRDADGDGQGGTPAECRAANEAGYSYNEWFIDCDDGSPDIFYGNVETAFDELDSNCDGLDYPTQGIARYEKDRVSFDIPSAARCTGRSLGIIGQAIWSADPTHCTASGGVVFVGNRGAVTVSGAALEARNVATGRVATDPIAPLGPNGVARVDYTQLEAGTYWLSLYVPAREAESTSTPLGASDAGVDSFLSSDANAPPINTPPGTAPLGTDAGQPPLTCVPLNQNGILVLPELTRCRTVP